MRKEIEVLKNHANLPAQRDEVSCPVADGVGTEPNLSGVPIFQAIQTAQKRGLAGTGRTAKHEASTTSYRQLYVDQSLKAAERFRQPFNRDCRNFVFRQSSYPRSSRLALAETALQTVADTREKETEAPID